MGTIEIVALVLGILLLQLAVAIPILLWLRRRSRRLQGALAAELSGERILLGPEPASYRGGSGPFSIVKGNAVAALSDRRLACRKLVGAPIDVPLEEVRGVREDKWFLRAYCSGRMHLILELASGDEVGFVFRDHPRWLAAVRAALANPGATS